MWLHTNTPSVATPSVPFARVDSCARSRSGAHEEPVLAAADAYSYVHLLFLSGIIVSAIGLKAAVGHVAGLSSPFLPVGGDPPQ